MRTRVAALSDGSDRGGLPAQALNDGGLAEAEFMELPPLRFWIRRDTRD